MTTHLQPKQHYEDQYDKLTVEKCRRLERIHRDSVKDEIKVPKGKNVSKEEMARAQITAHNMLMYFEKGEAYINRASTIQKWMDRDKERDEFLASTDAPRNIRCLTCNSILEDTFKHIHFGGFDEPDRILFMYDCPKGCLPRRAFFSDGEEWKAKPTLCSKCQSEVTHESEKKGDTIVTTYTCSHCGHTEEDVMNLSEKKEQEDKDFPKDRERFCLSEKEGQEYTQAKAQLEGISQFMKELEEKDKLKKEYDTAKTLKRLSVPQLKDYVAETLKDEPYTNLVFDKPEMSTLVALPFSIEDPTDAGEYESRQKLKKLLEKALKETNCRLMSDGISYRVGVLTGRLRIYEKEDDLAKLIQKETK